MRDEETGTFWQQISGRAISGPMAGSQLEPVHSDELSFGLWRSGEPNGMVLKPLTRDAKEYETKDWEARIGKYKTVLDFPNTGLQSRDLVLGVEAFGTSRAYPVKRILEAKVIEDRLGSEPIFDTSRDRMENRSAVLTHASLRERRRRPTSMPPAIRSWIPIAAANGISRAARSEESGMALV